MVITDPQNTAVGDQALLSNTGESNTATGFQALYSNTTGSQNTATGVNALYSNTTAYYNTAYGIIALYSNTTGGANTAIGDSALAGNTIGNVNTANGIQALGNNTTGNYNTANGAQALYSNTTGSHNIGLNGGWNLTTGDWNIDVGNDGIAGEGNTIRIGNANQTSTFIAGISGQTASGGVAVYVNTDGKLGTVTSSARFKDDIQPMEKASEALLALKPVTFHYKKAIDPTRKSQFGLLAEEVEKVNPDLVVRDKEGKPYTVRYDQVNAMLLNEFLKEHRKNEEQEKTIVELKSGMTVLAATVKEQATQIQKVSTQLEASKPAPQVVNNP